MSTNTTCAPAILMASDVATNVLATVMTSSPGPTPSVFKRDEDRIGPVGDADAVLDSAIPRKRVLEVLDVVARR